MAERSVDELRAELRNLGYLTHGIERWFALDPWSSRTFWAELAAVSTKAAVLVAFFAALPLVAIMAIRNQPLPIQDVALLFGIDLVASFVAVLVLVVMLALALRSRPTLAIDSPTTLTGMSVGLSSVIAAGILFWWSGFDAPPSGVELAVGGALLILLLTVAALVFSAALLSFSIHEARRIPAVAQKDRTIPLAIVAAIAAVVIGLWATRYGRPTQVEPPTQIVVAPTQQRVALLAVDGMTWDLFSAQRPDDLLLAFATPLRPFVGTRSSAERWAALGTGTPSSAHLVDAIDGVRRAGSGQVLQAISSNDLTIDTLAEPLGLARRVPLPPTVRRRHYVWEIMGSRDTTSVAVNWWVTDDERSPGLTSVSQSSIFAEAAAATDDPVDLAIAIDRVALDTMMREIEIGEPRFATAYLPNSTRARALPHRSGRPRRCLHRRRHCRTPDGRS